MLTPLLVKTLMGLDSDDITQALRRNGDSKTDQVYDTQFKGLTTSVDSATLDFVYTGRTIQTGLQAVPCTIYVWWDAVHDTILAEFML